MTSSEAIEWLKGIEKKYIHGGDEFFDNERKVAISMAISALEKQIPEKPKTKGCKFYDTYFCPSCPKVLIHKFKKEYGGDWSGGSKYKHCPDCGQALDWSDTE